MSTPNHPSNSTLSSHNTPTQSRLLYTPTNSFERGKRIDSEATRTPNRHVSRSPVNSISSLQSAERNEQLNRVQRECKELIQNSRGQLLEKLREKMSNGACLDMISDEDDFGEMDMSINPLETQKKQSNRSRFSSDREWNSETKFSRNPSFSHSNVTTPSKARVISELAHSIVSQVANHSANHPQLPQSQLQLQQSAPNHQFQLSQKSQRKNLYGPRVGQTRHVNGVNTTLEENPWNNPSTLALNTAPVPSSTSYFTSEELLYLAEELEKELSQEFAEWEIEDAIEHESERVKQESSGGSMSLMGDTFQGTNIDDFALAAYCEAMDERDEFLINQVQELEDISRSGVIAICPGCFKSNLLAEPLPSSPELQSVIHRDHFVPQIARTGSEWSAVSAKCIRVWCRCGFQVLLRRAEHTVSSDSALDTIRSLCEQAYFSHLSFRQRQQHNPCRSQLIFSVNNLNRGAQFGGSQDERNHCLENNEMARVGGESHANQVCISCSTCPFSTGVIEL